MINTHTEIIVAVRGWSHPSWNGSFYPDDLPEDWQLSYYGNEFNAVVVPASGWVGLDYVEVERWVEDVPEKFLFYLEVEDNSTDWEQTADFIKPLSSRLGGILLRPAEVDTGLDGISANIAAASRLATVSLLLPEGIEPDTAGKSLLKEYGIQCGWNVGVGEPGWMGEEFDSQLVVVRVPGNKNFTARQWRETIDASLPKGDIKDGTLLLMLECEDPKITDLRTAMMIGEMMSVPASLLQK